MSVCDLALFWPFCAETQIDTKERTAIYSRPISPSGFHRGVADRFWFVLSNQERSNLKAIRDEGHVDAVAGTPGMADFGLVFKRSEPTDFRRSDGCRT